MKTDPNLTRFFAFVLTALGMAKSDLKRMFDQLQKERKTVSELSDAKRMVEAELAKCQQKCHEFHERSDQMALELGDTNQKLRAERTLRATAWSPGS